MKRKHKDDPPDRKGKRVIRGKYQLYTLRKEYVPHHILTRHRFELPRRGR